jgi:hypothetical protein
MQVALHFGAHFTDHSKLIRCLGKNRDKLAQQGISVPQPSKYRRQLTSLLHDMRTTPMGGDEGASFISSICDIPNPSRIVMSNTNFLGTPNLALAKGLIYPKAAGRLGDFCDLFQANSVELFLAICNPATFLPTLFTESTETDFDTFIGPTSPLELRWSELIERIREAVPDVPLNVWCNEDTPLIWEQVVRDLAGVEPMEVLDGRHDLLSEIMTPDGMKRFESYLVSHPDMTEVQKRRVIAAFLDKFALEEELEQELDLPGWSNEFIEVLSETYDDDVYQIQRMPGVTLISP